VSRGYTLIEVVVVLAVFAVAAAVVAPAVGRTADSMKARTEVAGVATFLRLAREQAVTRQQPYEVIVDPETRALWLRRVSPESVGSIQASRHLSALLQIEVEPAPAAQRVVFLPEGSSSGGHMRIVAPGPRVYVITIDALTGRVTTRRGDS